MAKKSNSPLSYLFVCGLALVVIGCFFPLSTTKLFGLNGSTAFSIITSDSNGILKAGSLLAFCGAVAGIVLSFISVKNQGLLKLISLIVSIAGGLYVVFNTSSAGKNIAKATLNFGPGFYIILAGWIIAVIGWVLNRE
ncbi:MAG: hypothetical protein IJP62_06170 [Treponema sp.]|nr:hypothetical protein [Treponema sp.]